MHGSFPQMRRRRGASGSGRCELEHTAQLEESSPRRLVVMQLIEGRHASVDVVLGVEALRSEQAVCRIKRAGAASWREKELTPANWQDAGFGVYLLSLEPAEVERPGIAVMVSPAGDGDSPRALHAFEVVAAVPRVEATSIPRTILCGHILTLDQRGKPKMAVIVRPGQQGLVVGGVGISTEQVSVETDENGYFEFTTVSGALVHVQVPGIGYAKQFIVPPPPAPGVTVRLFSL